MILIRKAIQTIGKRERRKKPKNTGGFFSITKNNTKKNSAAIWEFKL